MRAGIPWSIGGDPPRAWRFPIRAWPNRGASLVIVIVVVMVIVIVIVIVIITHNSNNSSSSNNSVTERGAVA